MKKERQMCCEDRILRTNSCKIYLIFQQEKSASEMMLLFLLFALMAVVSFGDRTTTFTSCSPVQTLNWLGVDIFTFNIGVATGFLQFNVAGAAVDGPAFIIIEVGGLKLIKDLDHNKIYNPAGEPPPSSPLLLPF